MMEIFQCSVENSSENIDSLQAISENNSPTMVSICVSINYLDQSRVCLTNIEIALDVICKTWRI